MTRYTVLTTFPAGRASGNVGDQLIEIAVKRLVTRVRGTTEFLTIFREDPLDERLDEINATAAVLLPGFPIRDVPMYPGCYRLVPDLDRIKVPLIPVGANWNVYPGDGFSRNALRYSPETTAFLRRVADGVPQFSCREFHVCEVLRRHGITNSVMTGDPAWYDPDFLHVPLHTPATIERLVYSPPLSAFYLAQGLAVLEMLAETFPRAKRYCAMHLADAKSTTFTDRRPTNDASMRLDIAEKNARIRARARELGFEVLELAGNVAGLDFYRECDLHVGYECHAHLGFLRQRRPSVLIAEDARGVGFNYTLGTGGCDGFLRRKLEDAPRPREGGTSGYCVTAEEFAIAPAHPDVAAQVRQYLREELDTGFRRYQGLAKLIDETYDRAMLPFLHSLPG
ncbi:MAG: polysaccharide pyruvyl transferase family protein [Opitutaceae bacterium]|nr:polysaccharide pyruvyl transferase family protein [Opitutaceae bacterium]